MAAAATTAWRLRSRPLQLIATVARSGPPFWCRGAAVCRSNTALPLARLDGRRRAGRWCDADVRRSAGALLPASGRGVVAVGEISGTGAAWRHLAALLSTTSSNHEPLHRRPKTEVGGCGEWVVAATPHAPTQHTPTTLLSVYREREDQLRCGGLPLADALSSRQREREKERERRRESASSISALQYTHSHSLTASPLLFIPRASPSLLSLALFRFR